MYDDFYGFRHRPFQLTPDPAFYFESTTHRKALSYLGYGLAQGEGFIVITGEVGAGKSTLVAHLMATIDRARLTAAQVVTSRLDGVEMVQLVGQAFGLAAGGHDKPAVLGMIEAFLHDEARAGRRCLLVVDESQNLSIEALEELRMLSNFQLGAQPLLQVLLLGQPEFRDCLQGHPRLEQLRQRVIAAQHLDPMEPGEIEPYIMHRLKVAGWANNPTFDQRVFAELFTVTAGVPRRVNLVVNRLLLLGAVEQRKRVDGVMLAQVLSELNADGALQLGPPVEPGEQSASSIAPSTALGHHAKAAAAAASGIAAELALRDAQIAELQHAVLELANSHDAPPPIPVHDPVHDNVGELHERIASLEGRVIEQDRTLRHTLTMLIEWIERDETRAVAA